MKPPQRERETWKNWDFSIQAAQEHFRRSSPFGILRSTTHWWGEVQGCIHTAPSAQRQPDWENDGQGHRTQRVSSGCILKRRFSLTLEMWEVQLVRGEAAQQATLLPPLPQEAEGKVPAGRGHLDPAGKGSSSFCSPPRALGLGQRCRKATARGVPPALGVFGVLHPWIGGHRSQRAFPPEL